MNLPANEMRPVWSDVRVRERVKVCESLSRPSSNHPECFFAAMRLAVGPRRHGVRCFLRWCLNAALQMIRFQQKSLLGSGSRHRRPTFMFASHKSEMTDQRHEGAWAHSMENRRGLPAATLFLSLSVFLFISHVYRVQACCETPSRHPVTFTPVTPRYILLSVTFTHFHRIPAN